MRRTTGPDHILNLFGAGKHGFGDEQPGIRPATVVDVAMLNTWQEELARTVETAGLALNPADNTQLYQAIQLIAAEQAGSLDVDVNLIAGYAIERAAAANLRSGNGPLNFITRTLCAGFFGGEEIMFAGGSISNVATVTYGTGPLMAPPFGTPVTMPSAPANSFLMGSAFNGTNLIFVGGVSGSLSLIYSSASGTTYTNRLSATSPGPLYAVCIHQGQFVAVGFGGQVYRSASGTGGWTPSTISSGVTLRSVATDGTRLVAVGFVIASLTPTIYTSDDNGTTWQFRQGDFGGSSAQSLNSVVWTGSRWVAVGDRGEIQQSDDGTNWLRVLTTSTSILYGIAMLGDYLAMAVGENGDVFTSPPSGTTWVPVSKLAQKNDGTDTSTAQTVLFAVATSARYRRGYMAGQTTGTASSFFFTGSW